MEMYTFKQQSSETVYFSVHGVTCATRKMQGLRLMRVSSRSMIVSGVMNELGSWQSIREFVEEEGWNAPCKLRPPAGFR
jgi:hypothetical protein